MTSISFMFVHRAKHRWFKKRNEGGEGDEYSVLSEVYEL